MCPVVYNYAKKVKKGIIRDDTFLPVIYEVDEKDDWEDEKVWYKANPALGIFRSLEEMLSLYRYAKENPGFINTFKRLYLNMWTSQETRWLDIVKWDACPHETSLENLKGKICYGGLDLSATTDLTAFVLAFEDYSVLPFFFIPRQRMKERIKTDKVPYDVWERQGHVIVTEGEVIDYAAVEKKIDKLLSLYQIKQINYDRWNADYLVQRLTARGYLNMVQMGMGYQSMNTPTKYLESLILEGKLNHDGNPILRWNFDNCMLTTDPAGNIKPDKAKSTQRIDGIVATIMALDGLMRNLKKTSIYETQKVKVF
ncbi:MAG: terminase large subunit [Actinobacteria bacterium]|nr:terminase large subunit [Actinomycetota bacterium]